MYVISVMNYDSLSDTYSQLLNNYQILTGDFDTLFESNEDLELHYNSVCSTNKQQILPIQYCIFGEAVRRYYMPKYLEGKINKEYWKSYSEFCRDIVLHDTGQENLFTNVSNAFSDALKYGNNTMNLCRVIMSNTFADWVPNWDDHGLTGNELTDIDAIHQWCVDEIEYETDDNITNGQESFTWDYSKFSAETAFRTMGDCEDQVILEASYLESCGFETVVSIFHDSNHPTLGAFYHAVCLIHIDDTSLFSSTYPSCNLWRLESYDQYYPNYTWCYLDPTWDIPFGTEPSWLQDYGGSISYDIHSIAFCEVNGAVE